MASLEHRVFAGVTFTKLSAALLLLAGSCLYASNVHAKPYKGAEIQSLTQHRYGRIEVRMRMARGSGILSTFFTYKPGSEGPGALWEEIDIEAFGKSNATAWQSNILVGSPRVGSEQVHNAGSSLADGYHTFTIDWTPTSVVWQMDGVEVRRTNGGQANQLTNLHNFHFNLWASDVAGWAGAFESSALPQSQYVNWIRYYRYEAGAFVLDWSDDFNTFDTARWSKANWSFDGNLVDFDPNNVVVKDGTLVLCMTAEGQGGCSGAVPVDSAGNGGGGGGSGGGGNGGAAGMTGGGASSAGGTLANGGAGGTAGANGGSASGGAAANGGAAGTGGAAATAGSPSTAGGAAATSGASSGGAQAAAGAQGTGGSTMAGAPGSVAGNPAITTPQPADAGGCGCAIPARGSAREGSLWLVAALLLRARLLRKKRRAH
jgi:endo-1,3-1,4-beta-glycanase ExoK